ncbi:DUF4139 domain-containing protein [Sphingomonas sp. Leaf242]|uniref:DUF4139 domain-containing protein n=1 Tax=Sphingomonas sp. Leaf242 TaxID=1736304 RepID=UPI000A66DD3D|nr:hypothetical protein [Sphingomonas sp. Leaf242]
MRGVVALLAMLVGVPVMPATAQADRPTSKTVAASPPRHVSVTVYRNPHRERGQAPDLRYLGGFAVVTETRTIRLQAGEAVVTFAGVAGGIIPASAIITGLPGGTVEKNRDARLLSPAALIDGSLGRHVTLTRTSRATGAVRSEDAVIVAGPAGGVVVRTTQGVEALGCSGLPERPVYAKIPAGLSAQPVLSVTTRSPRATTATVTVSYLASKFDWVASYVATIAADGRTLDLFAWMTLANGNAESFANADVQVVAGRLERREIRAYRAAVAGLRLDCYPLGTTTSDLQTVDAPERDDIVVTGSLMGAPVMMRAAPAPVAPPPPPPPPPPEDLGDLKLYRVPEPVTVAANQMKQVALLSRSRVPFERRYRSQVQPGQTIAETPVRIELRMQNETRAGLGLPLPAGSTALYVERDGARGLIGLGRAADTPTGQRFTLAAGTSPGVLVRQVGDRTGHAVVTLSNANPFPVAVEIGIGRAGQKAFEAPTAALRRVDGVQTWTATVPANGTATLGYGY